MNNILSATIIGWETHSAKHTQKAVEVCKNYGLKPLMKDLYLGRLYEKERRALDVHMQQIFILKREKVFTGVLCQSCFTNLDPAHQEKASPFPAFEIIDFSTPSSKTLKKRI